MSFIFQSIANSFSLKKAFIFIGLVLHVSACVVTRTDLEIVSPTIPYEITDFQNEKKISEIKTDIFKGGEFTGSNDVKLRYRLLTPASSSSPARYPLVVMLHGSGAIGKDNEKQLSWLARSWAHPVIRSQFPAYVLVPQAPARSADYDKSAIDNELYSKPGMPLNAMLELIEQTIKRYPVDTRRVYVIGFSMGGSATWNALIIRPSLFAAAIPIAGIAPERYHAKQIASIPIMIVHGNADIENPIASDRAMFMALKTQPANKTRFIEYEKLDHRIPPEMIFSIGWREWLFTQNNNE